MAVSGRRRRRAGATDQHHVPVDRQGLAARLSPWPHPDQAGRRRSDQGGGPLRLTGLDDARGPDEVRLAWREARGRAVAPAVRAASAMTERDLTRAVADIARLFGWERYHTHRSDFSPAG